MLAEFRNSALGVFIEHPFVERKPLPPSFVKAQLLFYILHGSSLQEIHPSAITYSITDLFSGGIAWWTFRIVLVFLFSCAGGGQKGGGSPAGGGGAHSIAN